MAKKEVGKIVNDDVCFLNVNFSATILTGELNVDLDYDSRVIKNKEKLTEITNKYLEEVERLMAEDLKEESK